MDAEKIEGESTKIIVSTTQLVHYSLRLAIVWTIVIILFTAWNVYQKKQTTRALASKEARSHFNKDQATRLWVTTHGGVYVPTNERTPPNPHLKHVAERDIITPSGRKLTLMNPAYMLRQMMEESSELYGVKGRIISLKPFRSQNAPDDWERSALNAFETGVNEVSELTDINGEPYLRLIQPMMTKKGCLKCHGYQGYKVSDVRGGVGVSVPMSSFLLQERREIRQLIISYILIWLFGLGVIYSGFRGLRQRLSERDQAVIALHEREQEISATLNSIGDAVIATDIRGHVVRMNPVAERLTGWKVAEAMGHPLSEVFHIVNVTTRKTVENPYSTVLRKGDVVELADHTVLISRGGAEFQIADSGAPIHRNSSVVLGVVLVFRDVTQEYHTKKELKESETKYRTMMNSMKEPIYICSSDYIVEFMNKAMIKRIGRDATGEKCFFALHDLEKQCSWCMHDKILKKEYFELNIVSPKDNRSYHVSNSPLIHEDGSTSKLTVFRDMTKMKKMESQLRQAQKMEAIGTLAGGIAHDFNNILFPIVGYTELLREDIPQDSPLQESVTQVFRAALRAKDLVQQILTFSRQRDQEFKPVRLQIVLREALKLLGASIPKTIDIQVDLNPDCGMVVADPTQIHQIIMNLATNAYHAMQDSGGQLKVSLTQIQIESQLMGFDELPPGKYALFKVIDTGTGIKKDVMDKIFDPYFTTKPKDKGTGLGLSMVKGIAKSCNGDIHVYSELEKGTEVHVYLPIMEKISDNRTSGSLQPIQGGTEKILLVDDEEAIIKMVKEMLERLGYHVTSRSGSCEALEVFKANPGNFDLVITDMTMPDMTGVQLANEIKSIRPSTPVLICTGFSDKINEETCKELGVQGYLVKPIIKREMAQEIRNIFDKLDD